MALTIAVIRRNVVGAQREATVDITFDNSYPTGGEAFAPDDIDPAGNTSNSSFIAVGLMQKTLGNRICTYDYTNKKLQLWTALGTEATNASDQSTIIVRAQLRY